ncbi:hypothetical protein FGB62_405g01 [Gracilaria domingensis]|nr:hypothetical protein FGB62_405g07 [Gracilaria domingensis]KAI0556783.1 hypothetical protein FGB62_405g01 [Gracilaria domingensis]
MDTYPGGVKKPIQILLDARLLTEEDCRAKVSSIAKAWKAAHEGLLIGTGFGMAVHSLTPSDYSRINSYLATSKNLGDIITGLHTKHAPEKLGERYRGYEGKAVLVRFSKRKEYCDLLEAWVLSQQYILCRILERGLLTHAESAEEYRPSKELAVVTTVCCRFKICINAMCGMEDYIRIVEAGGAAVKVEKTRSALVSTEEVLGKQGAEPWEWGWRRNRRQACENTDDGLYVVYTVLAGRKGGFYLESMDITGIYITVTERTVRGFTGTKLGQTGKYYEYVPPVHPREVNSTRVFWMPVGSSIVLSASSVVRFGGHWENDVEIFGYVVRARRLERGAKMKYASVDDMSEYAQLDEYGNRTELMKGYENSIVKCVKWNKFMQHNQRDRRVLVGTIPSVMEVDQNGRGRKEMMRNMYDALCERETIADIYRSNPVLHMIRKEPGEDYEDDSGTETRRMWLGVQEKEWMVSDIPFAHMELMLGKRLSFPLDIAALRTGMLKELRGKAEGEKSNSGSESGYGSESEQSEESDDGDGDRMNEKGSASKSVSRE